MSGIGQLSKGAIVNRKVRFNFFGSGVSVVLLVPAVKKTRKCTVSRSLNHAFPKC